MTSRYDTFYGRDFTPGRDLPFISTDTDSVRAYQWEVQLNGLPAAFTVDQNDLTLAAKQVSPIGITSEDIVVDRVNDKVFYPGKTTQDEVTITFDNLTSKRTLPALWGWFTGAVYDPLTGEVYQNTRPGGANTPRFKASKMDIIQLDNTLQPFHVIRLAGVYPKSFKLAEHNYSTNEFHTIEVTFRFDFMDITRETSV